jgi:hypothetical protein
MPKRRQPSSAGGNVQKSPSSKAAALLTRGAYMKYLFENFLKSLFLPAAKPAGQVVINVLPSCCCSSCWTLFTNIPQVKM